jgi:predicted DNA-binding transcriptional regulator AlpA
MSVRPLLPPKVAAAALSVSLSTLKRMTAAGHIPKPVRISDRRVGYRPADIDRFLIGTRGDA